MIGSVTHALVAALCAQLVIAAPVPNNAPKYGQPSKSPKPVSPKPVQPVCKNRTQQNANFDDLAGIPGNLLNPIPSPYKGLLYQGFSYSSVIATGTGLQPGVRPHSGFNYAASNLVTQLQGTSTITTFYPGSTIKSFDLDSFYFACATMLGQGAAAVPAACNVQVTGYKGSDNSVSNAKQICSRQFQYNPTTSLGTVEQAFSGKIEGCKDLSFAVVTYSPPGGLAVTSPLLAVVIDDIKYSTCSQ